MKEAQNLDEIQSQAKKESIERLKRFWRSNGGKIDRLGGLESLARKTIDEMIGYEREISADLDTYVNMED